MRKRKWTSLDTKLVIFIVAFAAIVLPVVKCNEKKSQTKSPEVPYTKQAAADQFVYFDAVSIVPEELITKKTTANGKINYDRTVICRCETTDGDTVRIRMKPDVYKRTFDATANLVSGSNRDQTVYLKGQRIHGVVRQQRNGIAMETFLWFLELGPTE